MDNCGTCQVRAWAADGDLRKFLQCCGVQVNTPVRRVNSPLCLAISPPARNAKRSLGLAIKHLIEHWVERRRSL
eukprot:8229584-Pyramimonas_sp.AAC.1